MFQENWWNFIMAKSVLSKKDIELAKALKKEVRYESSKLAFMGFKLLLTRNNPLVSLRNYNKYLRQYIAEINPNKNTFVGTTEQLVQLLEMMRWSHKKFTTAKAETDFVLQQFPELRLHESLILNYIKSKK